VKGLLLVGASSPPDLGVDLEELSKTELYLTSSMGLAGAFGFWTDAPAEGFLLVETGTSPDSLLQGFGFVVVGCLPDLDVSLKVLLKV
jgi:hypothetical protein